MKTSLICLLLLAAVACAAPRAGEMAEDMREMEEEKRVEMAEAKREMNEEKRVEMEEEKREMNDDTRVAIAEEKRGAMSEETAVAEPEDRQTGVLSICYGPCPSPFPSCYFDGCYIVLDFLYVNGVCVCCRVRFIFQCYY